MGLVREFIVDRYNRRYRDLLVEVVYIGFGRELIWIYFFFRELCGEGLRRFLGVFCFWIRWVWVSWNKVRVGLVLGEMGSRGNIAFFSGMCFRVFLFFLYYKNGDDF